MKTRPIRLAFTACLLTATLWACGQKLPAEDPIPILTPREVAELEVSDDGPFLLDVRTPKEFGKGRIPGAVNIPHKQLERRIAEIEPYREGDVIVYCETGGRARYAVDVLGKLGFKNLALVEGDMRKWRKNSLPIER
jgi:rhodanese-related sulfurtransferase